jgi:hypothetical protein
MEAVKESHPSTDKAKVLAFKEAKVIFRWLCISKSSSLLGDLMSVRHGSKNSSDGALKSVI